MVPSDDMRFALVSQRADKFDRLGGHRALVRQIAQEKELKVAAVRAEFGQNALQKLLQLAQATFLGLFFKLQKSSSSVLFDAICKFMRIRILFNLP